MAFDGEREPNVGLVGFAMDARPPHAVTSRSQLQLGHNFAKRRQQPLRLLAGSEGDAHTTVASRIGRAVAHQYPTLSHSRHELAMPLADPHQHEIRLARPPGDAQPCQLVLQLRAAGLHLGHIAGDILAVRQRRRQRQQRHRIHAIWRRHSPHHRHLLSRSGEDANAQARQPVCLRERSRHKQIGQRSNVGHHCLTMKIKVRLIHQQRRIRRSLRNRQQLLARCHTASRIVRTGNRDQLRARANAAPAPSPRETAGPRRTAPGRRSLPSPQRKSRTC